MKFIKAIKGKTVNGYGFVPVAGRHLRLSEGNKEDSLSWFASMAAEALHPVLTAPLIVPVPPKSAVLGSESAGRVGSVSHLLAQLLPDAQVWDGLRWIQPLRRAHEGGSRDADFLFAHLVATGPTVKAESILLLDDVLKTGAHLHAASLELDRVGMAVTHGLAAGRAVAMPWDSPFEPRVEVLDW